MTTPRNVNDFVIIILIVIVFGVMKNLDTRSVQYQWKKS